MKVGDWLQTWLNVITAPGERVFEEERAKPQAQLSTALIWVALTAVVTGLLAWFAARFITAPLGGAMLNDLLAQAGLPAEVLEGAQGLPGLGAMTPAAGIGGLLGGILLSMVGFLIFVGLLHLTARILGGTGNFGKYAYLIAAFYVPLSLVSSVVGLVPVAGACIVLIILIYDLVLAYFATSVEHKLSGARAVITVLVPLVLIVGLATCLIMAVFSVFFSLGNPGR